MNKLNGYTDPKNTPVLSSHKLQNNKGFLCLSSCAELRFAAGFGDW